MTDRLRWCRVRIKDARNGMVTRRARAGQSRLFEILRVLARLPHLQRATDSIPAGAHCPPIDVLLALSFIFFNWRRFQQVRRLRNWAWSKATVMGLTVLSKPRLSRYSFL